MNIPSITDLDEWNYLDSLKEFSHVGNPKSADQGYYARVLRYKYRECHARLTATTFQVLQPGISAVLVPLTEKQIARQQLFDAFGTSGSASTITKDRWLRVLAKNDLLPDHP